MAMATLELVVANLDEPVKVFRNDSQSGHRAVIRLQGNVSNRLGIGAMIEATIQAKDDTAGATTKLVRLMNPYTGYQSSNQPEVHFGLGDCDKIQKLVVRWPSKAVQEFTDLPADHVFTISEPDSGAASAQTPETVQPLFKAIVANNAIHREKPFDDFALQPLLPNKLSQLGPGLADGRFEW